MSIAEHNSLPGSQCGLTVLNRFTQKTLVRSTVFTTAPAVAGGHRLHDFDDRASCDARAKGLFRAERGRATLGTRRLRTTAGTIDRRDPAVAGSVSMSALGGKRMRRFNLAGLALVAVVGAASSAHAALSLSQTYFGAPVVYANGGGSGFGGPLGSGSLAVSLSGSNVVFTATSGSGTWDNNIALWIDANPNAGLTDAQMNDISDPGRGVLSSPIRASNVNFPGTGATADNTILPEYGIVFGGFGSVSFKLGNNVAHTFDVFQAPTVATRSISIPFASLGITNPDAKPSFNFFAMFVSDSGYASNESLPAGSLQGTGNPGFGDGQFGGAATPQGGFGVNNFNQFVVPEPSALSLLTLPGLFLARRRRA